MAVTSQLGNGFPDIVVGKRGANLLVELKDGDKPPSAQKLTADELKFAVTWRGSVIVARDVDEVLKWFG